jgi:hypothetical protein
LSLATNQIAGRAIAAIDWAKYRQTKGAIKLHVLLDHDGYLPVYAHVTEGNVPEIEIARALSLPKGSIVVMDRGYIDYKYKLFSRWTKDGIRFVTRLKEKADYVAWEDRPVPRGSNVGKDELIRLNPLMAGAPCREDLRVVTVWDEEKRREIQLLTNELSSALLRSAPFTRSVGKSSCFLRHSNRASISRPSSAAAQARYGRRFGQH